MFITLDISQQKNDDYENINGLNPLYLMIHRVIGHLKKTMIANT